MLMNVANGRGASGKRSSSSRTETRLLLISVVNSSLARRVSVLLVASSFADAAIVSMFLDSLVDLMT